jgi:hypothetical protein
VQRGFLGRGESVVRPWAPTSSEQVSFYRQAYAWPNARRSVVRVLRSALADTAVTASAVSASPLEHGGDLGRVRGNGGRGHEDAPLDAQVIDTASECLLGPALIVTGIPSPGAGVARDETVLLTTCDETTARRCRAAALFPLVLRDWQGFFPSGAQSPVGRDGSPNLDADRDDTEGFRILASHSTSLRIAVTSRNE